MRLTIPAQVVFETLDGEAVLLNLQDGRYFTLNPMGTRMWELIREHGGVDQIVKTLVAEYEVEPGVLEADLLRLVVRLKESGLLLVDDHD